MLLVTIDTMRADALGPDTPFLASWASRGVRFLRARTPIPLTLPAHASLLTGLAPPGHGLRDNTAPPLPAAGRRDFSLLAEEFAEAGHETAAFVASNVLDRRYGLASGFARFEAPPSPASGELRFAEFDAPEQADRALRWLASRRKDRPFFLWVHFFDPHDDYRQFDGDERRPATDAQIDDARELYAGEVRRVDAALERIFAAIDPARTVVLVAADHGESLGEHGEATHGHLCYGCTMDIPLLLAGPGVPEGLEDARACSLVDVAPTLRRLCALPSRRSDGRDLLAPALPRVIEGESLYAHRLYGWAQVSAAFDGERSLVDAGPRLEFFDLRSDPRELAAQPRTEGDPGQERLERALDAYRARRREGGAGGDLENPTPYGSLRRPDEGFLPPARNRALPDVVSGLPGLSALYRLRSAVGARDGEAAREAMAAVEALFGADPNNPALPLELGRALLLLGEPGRAAQALERAWELGYVAPDLLRLRVAAHLRAADPEGARRCLERARGMVPDAVLEELERLLG
ncbi:MAG: sulfatase [Planctomycetaceae bacterium]